MDKNQLLEKIIEIGLEIEDKITWNQPIKKLVDNGNKLIKQYGEKEIFEMEYENTELEYALQFINGGKK